MTSAQVLLATWHDELVGSLVGLFIWTVVSTCGADFALWCSDPFTRGACSACAGSTPGGMLRHEPLAVSFTSSETQRVVQRSAQHTCAPSVSGACGARFHAARLTLMISVVDIPPVYGGSIS